ncbi:MAG: AIDA repeat-containing protein, partial [Lentisphaeria bacterium]|nr:AIDA repeat-containing protein [Lentisphaeria bacterium]
AVKNFVINYTSAPSTIMSGGLLVSSAAVLSDKRLTSGMSMFVSQAGSAMRTQVSSGAVQQVFSGGTATSTTVRNGGVMYVSGGGSALDLNLSGGTAYIYNNGSAGNVKIHSDGVLNVSNTAVVSGVYVSSGGKITAPVSANVSAVTFASGAAISSFILQTLQYYDKLPDNLNLNNVILSGSAVLSSGAVVKNIEMGYKDKLTVSSGGTASLKFNPWRGTVSSAAGASVEYLDREANVYYGGSATGILSKGNTLDNLDITNKQSAAVYSNGLLRNAELYSSGYAHIYGGAANNTTINSGGSMHISEGFANHTQVNSSGYMYISRNGSADNTTVNSAGRVYIYGQAAGMQVTTGGSVNVCSEGILSNGTVTTGGRVNVSSGGSANNMDIAGGSIYISSGASAGTIAVGSSGYAAVYGGGEADLLQVASYGSAYVADGGYIGSADTSSGGKLTLYGELSSANVGSRTELTLESTAIFNSIHVESAGKLYLAACTVNGAITTERGSQLVLLGDSKSNVNITVKGVLDTTPLKSHTLDMQNHTLTLDLQDHSGAAAYMLDNLANIKNYKLAVTVSASQVSGSYTLARGAKDFTGSITVKCGTLQSSISVGSSVTLGNAEYTLALNSSNYLTLTVNNSNTEVHPTTSEYIPGTWSTDWEQASEYARKNNKLIFLFCGEKSACAPTDVMENKLLKDPEFLKLAKNNLVLLHNTNPTDKSYDGSPVGYLLDYNGTSVASRSGFGANYYNSWMEWLKLNLGIGSKGVHIFSGGNIETHNIYSGAVITNQTVYVLGVTIQDWQIEACDVCAGCSGVHIISGGIASNVKINTMGSMSISSGGIANNTTISSGFMTVFSGGTVNNTNIIYYALNISNGGTANNTTASSRGGLNVYSQGIALNTFLSGRYMHLYGVANSTTVNSGGYIDINSGGTANSTTISFDGYMYISSGGAASNTIVNSGGSAFVYNGGAASNTIVNSGGSAVVYNGGYASGGSVDLYGRMSIASGAAAVEIKENGGYVYVAEGANATFAANTVNGLTLNTSMTVHQNTVANNITLDSSGIIYIYGGSANNTTVNSGGYMFLFYGGSANNTIVNNAGRIYISSGGSAANTTLNGGYLAISGGETTSSLVNGGTEDVFTDGTTYNATVMSGGRILLAGGKAVSTIVSSGGNLSVRSHSGALSYASDAQILSGGFMDVYDSSTAESTVIEQGGYVRVRNYGSAVSTLIKSGASMYVHSSSGYAYDTVISGFGRVYDGATMSKTVIASGGSFHLWRGGILKDVNVQYGGLLDLRESAPVLAGDVIVTGQLKASYNQNVDASQAKIVADLAPRKTTNDYSIINLDYLGKTNLTVNVDLNQADGTYKLASNAAKWDSALALTVTENYLGKTYTSTLTETLEINQKFLYNNKLYTLSKTSNNLMLDIKTVDSKVPAKPVISISSGSWTNSDVKIKATYCDNSVKKEYSFDQKNWYAYTGEIVVSENKTVYFRGGNEYDVYGAVAAVPITFIDKLNPALTLSVDKTALTNQNVTVTALFNDSLSGIKSVTYLWDGQDGNMTGWLNGDSYTAAGNGTIYFKVVDNANNSVLKSYRVNNIDKTVPELTISGNLSTPTSKVKLSATAADNSGNVTLQYSFGRQNWSNGASLELTENCTVYFRAMDNAGNETLKTLIVSNIDKSAPDKSTVFADITNTTTRAVTVTMIFGSNAVQKEYSLDGKNYLPYPENGVVITQNGTVYFRSIDKAGNISEITEYVVNNIDKLAAAKPVAAADITAATNKNVTVTATFSQDTVVREYSLDNINWNTYTTGIVFEENGTVCFRGTDLAGNISETTEYVV